MTSRGSRTWLILSVILSSMTYAQKMHDCPLGWVSHSDHCYHFVFYPTQPYEVATSTCEQDGAYVLSVNTEAEHEFLSDWLTRHELNRARRWWTSGAGPESTLHWEGDGTHFTLDTASKWGEPLARQVDSMYVVYAFTTLTNTFLWGRQYHNVPSPFVCEISKQESFRIHQAQRDFTYGTKFTDPEVAPRGPRFTVIPESVVIVDRMESAYLECAADSIPPATYTWYKLNGAGATKITTTMDPRYSLTNGRFSFQHPQEVRDSGLYYCVAENEFGSIKTHPVRVSFGYIGDFSNDPPGAVRVNQYQGTVINCNPPRYNPDASFAWFKGPGANFLRTDLNTYQFVSYNGRLYLSETQLADAGMYHCVVTLAVRLGEQASTVQPPSRTSLGIELIIRGDTATDFGPHIHNDFPAVFPTPALRGEKLRLECLAYGRMPLLYSWSRDNGPIPSKASYTEENKVLIIPDAELEDSGNYTCRVERGNKAYDNKTISVQVEAAPFFMFPLRDQHVDINSRVTMRCEAGGVPHPIYSWFKDGQPLTSKTGDVEVTVNVVVIREADPLRHNGMYECQATNMYGTRLSSAQLRVLSFAPSFDKRPVDDSQMATVSGNTTIICQPEASPLPEITWSHNNAALNLVRGAEGRVMMLENGNLLITQVQPSDQGHYTCTAENSDGQASSTGFLNVVSQTTITMPPHDTHVDVNSTAFLQCQASFDPKHHDVVYTWTFNGFPIDTDHDPIFRMSLRDGHTGMYIINAQFDHDGQYECHAVSVDDRASASAYLTVQGPPSEPAGVHGYTKNMAVHLLWTPSNTHGADILFYNIEYMSLFNPEWRTVHTQLWAADVADKEYPEKCSYSISDLSPGSSYSFRVTAANRFGLGAPSQPSSYIKIPDSPPRKAPEEISITFSTAGTLAFMWTELSPEDLTGNGVGYKLYWRKKSEDIVRDGLWQSDRVYGRVNSYYTFVGGENFYLPYEIKVAGFNALGDGPNSTVFVIMSAEDLPIAAPRHVRGEAYNGTAIMVDWDPLDKSRKAIRGKIMGYQINYWWEKDPGLLMSSNVWCEDCVDSLVIGLLPDENYWVNIQVFNVAGLGPKSEDYFIATPLWPPRRYPEYVSVSSHGPHSVFVQWRGVRIGPKEEALYGYKLWWWPATEHIRTANETVVYGYRQTTAVIDGIKDSVVYVLRVLGFSYAGDGKKAPAVYFTLEGMVMYNPVTTEILAGSCHVTLSVWTLLLTCCLGWQLS